MDELDLEKLVGECEKIVRGLVSNPKSKGQPIEALMVAAMSVGYQAGMGDDWKVRRTRSNAALFLMAPLALRLRQKAAKP